MSVSPEYREWVVEQLRHAGTVTGRSMFGGYALYLDGAIFALIDDDVVYFKVDDSNRPGYEAAGMGPFRPMGDEQVMQYYEVPADVLEDPDRLCEWADAAAAVSRRKTRKPRKRK
ncbi:MAG TPA: TfoX/Sxy family protein [Longimicrobiaceae bacterium]|nr:TfoX/Sxy family protein [Longimicrobiaceae bacterium]